MTRTVFQGAMLIDGTNEVVRDASAVVSGRHIDDVVVGSAVAIEPADRVIDLHGKTLMPGMVICHFHAQFHDVGEGGRHGFYTGSERPVGVQMINALNAAQTALRSGFTGIVSAGCSDALDAQLKMAIAEGLCEGPRILPASHMLEPTGYEGETVPWWREVGNTGTYLFVDGPDEYRKAVRMEIRRGAEIIKVQPSGGHGYPTGGGQATFGGVTTDLPHSRLVKMDRSELEAVVGAAHMKGKKVRAHVAWPEMILECVELGVDVIDHGDEIDEECIEAMAAKGTFWTPSVVYLRRLMDNDRAPDEHRASVQADYEHVLKMVPIADEAGVKIVIGDDWGIPGVMPHALGCYVEELELYVRDAGVAPTDALRWATRNGAELLGVPGLGSVEKGGIADLLVVEGDLSADLAPLRDPGQNLRMIMKDGELVKDEL